MAKIICSFIEYFNPHASIEDVPGIMFHDFQKKYKVSIQQSNGSKTYWIEIKIIKCANKN